jgi:hypothetical protein
MSDDTVYLPTDAAVTAVQIPSDLESFCTSFNAARRDYVFSRGPSAHVWFDGKNLRIDGALKNARNPEIGDWIITTPGEEKVVSDLTFRRDYLPTSRTTIKALRTIGDQRQ